MKNLVKFLFTAFAIVLGTGIAATFTYTVRTAIKNLDFYLGSTPPSIAPIVSAEEKISPPEEISPPLSRPTIRPFLEAKNTLLQSGEPFIEVNLEEKIITYYSGALDQILDPDITVPIKKAGDPQGWGGTPAGVYKVLSKSRAAFSASAETYMPYALQIYGKYFIHGEPYYPSGEKTDLGDFSGGCVQSWDEKIEPIYKQTKTGTPILIVDKNYDDFIYPSKKGIDGNGIEVPNVTADSYLVADLDSGEILTEKNRGVVYPIASITKLMNVIVMAEHTDLRKKAHASKSAFNFPFANPSLLVSGNYYKTVDLMYPTLIESSNTGAEITASFLGRARTITLMNEKTQDLFMNSTHYTDPTGLDPGNVSTAHDLYLLARYILNNRRPMLDITVGKKVTAFGPIEFNINALKNKNEFADHPDFLGGKTGYTVPSQYTGLFLWTIVIGDTPRNIAIVVLKSEDLKSDAESLLLWVKENYN